MTNENATEGFEDEAILQNVPTKAITSRLHRKIRQVLKEKRFDETGAHNPSLRG